MPKPVSSAMMLGGYGGIGFAMRRGKNKVATAVLRLILYCLRLNDTLLPLGEGGGFLASGVGRRRLLTMIDRAEPAPIPINDSAAEHLVAAYDGAAPHSAETKAAAMMTDEFLRRAYQRVSKEAGNPEATALRAEIKRRSLDV